MKRPLDVQPTPTQRAVLNRLARGDRLHVEPSGAIAFQHALPTPRPRTIQALVARGWIREPDLPLFAAAGAGRITLRGAADLEGWRR